MAAAFRGILLDHELDPALAAQILTLPYENEMAGLFDSMNPVAIHSVHAVLTSYLANKLDDELLAVHRASPYGEYRVEHRDMACWCCVTAVCTIWRSASAIGLFLLPPAILSGRQHERHAGGNGGGRVSQ